MTDRPWDVAVVGGGIVGLASALALSERPGLRLLLLEAEDQLAVHFVKHRKGCFQKIPLLGSCPLVDGISRDRRLTARD